MSKAIGTVHPAGSMFLRFACGTAKSGDGDFEISHSAAGTPIVRHEGTGKYFTLGWSHILDLAVKAGISTPDSGSSNPQSEIAKPQSGGKEAADGEPS